MPTKSEQLLEKSKTFEQQLKCFILAELERINASGASSGLASEVTVASILAKLTSSQKTPALTRVSGIANSSVAAGARSVSFFNAGSTDATVAGGVLKPGEAITFDAGGQNDTLAVIPYITIATGDLVITTVV